ncbi:5-oxoprolinase subunit PxpB [Plebeiibacterium marinum]|uniref:5-oxoprolinase subunit PxpB n=1 Tax=Plebeiibacterium marinum TaxID=2992111 RepID=A0AAE3SIF4_9BACT|nr:5-oxoprolinase subunit PxpB [Plebeiobacterium marinum]MCW3804324.1 5-oxoprolinase subunit PxpB [Plebeiobacterium marinum]
MKILPSGDSAFLLKLGDVISHEIHIRVQGLYHLITNAEIEAITDIVPSYCDILVHYNPSIINYKDLLKEIKLLYTRISDTKLPPAQTITIPVLYGGAHGFDMETVQKHTSFSEKEIIKLHSSEKYLVYMLGFTPGFCYLGGMNPELSTPRKKIPSQMIPAGSVGIAAGQTGIYPIDSPGGWQIIGRTPLKLFDPSNEHPFLLKAGNYIKFEPITKNEYEAYF